ncbi:hypothetical protein DSO57_1021569 [Entomophthora muscae]|uniref:Uncharacterized protein n=1 Tax=Entomophthora muscae TaxID=34485 RepID=A0ACC2U1B2_9FUNG|nr:hypothetical protein DSO57_1021569 [Entomophthora muscae]
MNSPEEIPVIDSLGKSITEGHFKQGLLGKSEKAKLVDNGFDYCVKPWMGIEPKNFQDLVGLLNSELNVKIKFSQFLPVSFGFGQSNKAKSTSDRLVNSFGDVNKVLDSAYAKTVLLPAVPAENTTPGFCLLWSDYISHQAKPDS